MPGGEIYMQVVFIYYLFIIVPKCRFEKTEEPGFSGIYTQTDFEWLVVESLCVTGSICCVPGPL